MRLKRVVSESRDPLILLLGAMLLACASAPPAHGARVVPATEATESAPRSPPVRSPRVRRAEALLAKGDAESARAAFEEALAEDARDVRALLGLGLAFEALGKASEAEDAYRRAITIEPSFAEAHNNLGLLLRARGADEEAIAELERALAADPRLASAQVNLALALEDAGRSDEAERAYAQAVALAPDDAMLRANRGLFLLARGDASAAVVELRSGLAKARGDRAALLALGNGLRRAQQPVDAVRALRMAIEAGDGKPTPALLSELALAENASGDAPAARASLTQALSIDPRYATAHYLLGSLDAAANDVRSARQHFERCIALEPRGPLADKARERLTALRDSRR